VDKDHRRAGEAFGERSTRVSSATTANTTTLTRVLPKPDPQVQRLQTGLESVTFFTTYNPDLLRVHVNDNLLYTALVDGGLPVQDFGNPLIRPRCPRNGLGRFRPGPRQ